MSKTNKIADMMKVNKTFRNAIIFAFVFSLLFSFDIIFKIFIFDNDAYEFSKLNHDKLLSSNGFVDSKDYIIIGTRSFAHYSTTFLDIMNVPMNFTLNITLSLFFGLILILLIILSKSKTAVIGLSMMLAGLLGNTLDRWFTGYVRDMFFLPWLDRGTFNFADVILISGFPLVIIPTIINIYKKPEITQQNKNYEKIKQNKKPETT